MKLPPKIERNFRKWKLLSTQVFWGALIVAETISLFKKPAQCLRYYKTPGTHKTEYYLSLSAPVEALEEMKPLV